MYIPWRKIHSGKLIRAEILTYTHDPEWQKFRKALKGTPLEERFAMLQKYLEISKSNTASYRNAKVCVTNYINALARAGMISLAREQLDLPLDLPLEV